jgi:hypothetical protein
VATRVLLSGGRSQGRERRKGGGLVADISESGWSGMGAAWHSAPHYVERERERETTWVRGWAEADRWALP